MEIEDTLKERGARYGDFGDHAKITQNIKRAMISSTNWNDLADDQRECLEMIAHKIGRILNGDPNYHDSWHDIVGYTKLVADRLQIVTETFCPLEEIINEDERDELTAAEVAARNLRREMSRIDNQAINRAFIEGDDAEAFE